MTARTKVSYFLKQHSFQYVNDSQDLDLMKEQNNPFIWRNFSQTMTTIKKIFFNCNDLIKNKNKLPSQEGQNFKVLLESFVLLPKSGKLKVLEIWFSYL